MSELLKLDDEQEYMAEFTLDRGRSWNQSDCGVGKTLSQIHAYHLGRQRGHVTGQVVALCTKTSMVVAWVNDIIKYNAGFGTNYTFAVADAAHREAAFSSGADFIIVNHDGVKWMVENMRLLTQQRFQWLLIDEATAYKNPNSDRTKALMAVRILFEWRTAMSGTPYAKSVMDAFMPTFIVDDGDHLGNSFYAARNQFQSPQRMGRDPKSIQWRDLPQSKDMMIEALSDMTVRFELKLNVRNEELYFHVPMPPKVRLAYEFMCEHGIYEDDGQTAIAVNAAVKLNKMLQILTGSIYDADGKAILVDTGRYEFVIDKVMERSHPSLVIYNWTHELEMLMKYAKKHRLRHAFINSSVTGDKRTAIVDAFQAGELDCIFAHPKTVAHAVTLTHGDAVIWASPPNSPELLYQANKRVNRRGQTKDNQILYICAKDSKEEEVYKRLQDPLATQAEILAVFAQASRGALA